MDMNHTDRIGVHTREVVLDLTEAVETTINQQPGIDLNQRQLLREQSNDLSFEVFHPQVFVILLSHFRSNRSHSTIPINYTMLTRLADKSPDDILSDLLKPNFSLKALLKHPRMKTEYDWVFHMTRILERVTRCEGAEQRIAMVLTQIPSTDYVEGVYSFVRQQDPITDELHYDFLRSFLKMFTRLLALLPLSAESLMTISERIELTVGKTASTLPVRSLWIRVIPSLPSMICFSGTSGNRNDPRRGSRTSARDRETC